MLHWAITFLIIGLIAALLGGHRSRWYSDLHRLCAVCHICHRRHRQFGYGQTASCITRNA